MGVNRLTRMKAGATALVLVAMVCVGAGVLFAQVASAAAADNVKYYEVAGSYAGQPENLSEIALRFLGSSTRSKEIFDRNVGRTQPDGGSLTDPNSLHKGWLLVLPWDAVGDGVRIGPLPTNAPPTPPATTGSVAYATPSAQASVVAQASGGCATAAAPQAGSNWGALRMAPDDAWTRSRGEGVMVAIIDSGVDASVPQLAGRVAEGADIVSGSGRGNTDCLGSGTAMAGIIVAQPGQSSTLRGIAPGIGRAANTSRDDLAEGPAGRPD